LIIFSLWSPPPRYLRIHFQCINFIRPCACTCPMRLCRVSPGSQSNWAHGAQIRRRSRRRFRQLLLHLAVPSYGMSINSLCPGGIPLEPVAPPWSIYANILSLLRLRFLTWAAPSYFLLYCEVFGINYANQWHLRVQVGVTKNRELSMNGFWHLN